MTCPWTSHHYYPYNYPPHPVDGGWTGLRLYYLIGTAEVGWILVDWVEEACRRVSLHALIQTAYRGVVSPLYAHAALRNWKKQSFHSGKASTEGVSETVRESLPALRDSTGEPASSPRQYGRACQLSKASLFCNYKLIHLCFFIYFLFYCLIDEFPATFGRYSKLGVVLSWRASIYISYNVT